MVGIMITVGVVLVLEHQTGGLQVDVPCCRTPGDGKQDGDEGAKAQHWQIPVGSPGDPASLRLRRGATK